ncbi:hypothetical protein KUCAC02_001229, partial [Chaenocephalus aceratus]
VFVLHRALVLRSGGGGGSTGGTASGSQETFCFVPRIIRNAVCLMTRGGVGEYKAKEVGMVRKPFISFTGLIPRQKKGPLSGTVCS